MSMLEVLHKLGFSVVSVGEFSDHFARDLVVLALPGAHGCAQKGVV